MIQRYQSRLNRRLQKQTKRNFLIAIVGIIIIVLLLIKFGVPFLINLSLLSANKKDQATSQANSSAVVYIPPPTLNDLPNATNSATIKIAGNEDQKYTVKLYVNNSLIDTATPDDTGTFYFANVSLKTGGNTIQAKAVAQNGKESSFSPTQSITLLTKGPDVSIDQPQDGQHFTGDQNQVTIKGKTDPSANVTINGSWAIVASDGSYSYTMTMQNGDNNIKVIATDEAGNKTEKDITIHYDH